MHIVIVRVYHALVFTFYCTVYTRTSTCIVFILISTPSLLNRTKQVDNILIFYNLPRLCIREVSVRNKQSRGKTGGKFNYTLHMSTYIKDNLKLELTSNVFTKTNPKSN